MKILSISVVVPTYNSTKTLEGLLKSIREQEYNQEKIEIILSDGGSKDNILALAQKYKAKIISVVPKKLQNAEYNRAFGAKKAKNEILAFFDHDNILPSKKIFSHMIQPLLDNEDIIGVETLHYHYSKSFSLLDRYFALFGVNDPLPFYLKKADRQSYMYSSGYHLSGNARRIKNYYEVKFSSDNVPTLGSNGFLIRKKILMKYANIKLQHFFHIDVNVDLIKKGYNRYAFTTDSITHLSGHYDFFSYLWRRMLYMKKYHFEDKGKRRYSVFEKKDLFGLLYFIVISTTFVKPTFDAIRGFIVIQDIAWFLHPFMCFGTVIVYGYTFITAKLSFKHI